ncbi:Formamidase, partial [termite gut metagenome]
MEKKIKAGLIQQSNVSAVEDNIKNIAKNIESCAQQGARLVVLQELHNSLYFCQTEDVNMFNLAEAIPGPSTDFYSDLAVTHHIVLVISLFEKRAPGLYHNTAVVFDQDGSIAGKYRKMHIPEAARLMTLKGAEILIYPTAIGWESSDTDGEKSRQLNAWIIS